MIASSNLSDIVGNAEYLAHRYDEFGDAFRFSPVPRELHRECTFITDEHLPDDLPYSAFKRSDVTALEKPKAPVHFIFHSAYCCSTMLARAFDIEGVSMGLKEPQILNDMIGWQRRGAPADKHRQILDESLALLERPFSGDRAVVIKPSNICTPLAIPMLEMRPDARALLLYAPIKSFLLSIAKKEMWGRIWVRDVLLDTRKDGYLIGGFTDEDLLKLTDLQVAAVGWLSQHAAFAKIVEAIGDDRVKTLDSETFLARSTETIGAFSDFFGLDLTADKIDAVMAGPAFNSHSKLDQRKPGEIFDAKARTDEQNRMAELHGAEIDMITDWAQAVAESQNIKMDIGPALLYG
ncbi:hypothetical protein MNBD_ALPHA04-754 [hydrothermal vent metagenome]|uniref:Uncharacterized protein n=1 Tax=hydrothermal vent metagenome TaxID=652676 RepID=A0A3B0SQV4_9ZZZZ